MTPDEELELLDSELERLQNEYPTSMGVLRLTNKSLRMCSKWKWEQHGWTISEGQACGIMNGNNRERKNALLSVLKGHIQDVQFASDLEVLKIVVSSSTTNPV